MSKIEIKGDSGSWKEKSEEEAAFESPELHLLIKTSGILLVSLFFIVFIASLFGYGLMAAVLSVSIFTLFFSFFSPLIFLFAKTGNVRLEVNRIRKIWSELSNSPLKENKLTREEIKEFIKSEEVVSDLEIAIKDGYSVGEVHSILSHMEKEGEISCRQFGKRVVCWENKSK